MNKSFAAHSDNLEVIPVINIASEDLSQHMVGVNKVIHSAAPLYTVGDTNEILAVSFCCCILVGVESIQRIIAARALLKDL